MELNAHLAMITFQKLMGYFYAYAVKMLFLIAIQSLIVARVGHHFLSLLIQTTLKKNQTEVYL